MIELLFVACLSASPTTCESKAMQFTDISAMTCLMGAQPVLAKWAQEHPAWQVERWSCQAVGPERET